MSATFRFLRVPTWQCLIVLLCVSGISGCSGSTAPTEEPDPLVGTWNWVGSLGGFTGGKSTPESLGHTETYTYRSDGIFEFRVDGELKLQVPYVVIEADSLVYPFLSMVDYDAEHRPWWQPDQWLWSLDGDTLKLHDACVDCYNRTFARVQ